MILVNHCHLALINQDDLGEIGDFRPGIVKLPKKRAAKNCDNYSKVLKKI
jgi:hypothetical protein